MALVPLSEEHGPKARDFLVYDFEWIPGTLQMRLCGLHDGRRYRAFSTVNAFLNAVLSSDNRGRWFYAHAGGLADVQFVLEAIIDRHHVRMLDVVETHDGEAVRGRGDGDITIEAKFSGSSAVIVHVRQGKNVWHFVDSYWLLRDSLKNIGKSLGLHKTGPHDSDDDDYDEEAAREWYSSVPLLELRDYNERDCEILWRAIDRFETTILELGGQLNMTLASTALGLFRRRFLKMPISTVGYVNERAAKSYIASRVEVFNRYATESYYFDINSSFPFAMTLPQPGEMSTIGRRFPMTYDDARPFLAECDVQVPETYFPPLPYRGAGNRVFFPVGRWRSWFTSIDLELLESEGGKIRAVHEVIRFEPFYDLADYAHTIYNLRKASSDPFERVIYKLLANSLYGKFAESSLKTTFHHNPSATTLAGFRDKRTGDFHPGVELLFPGGWLHEKESTVPHQHIPASSYIVSIARRSLYQYMNHTEGFDYCDTDGFNAHSLLQSGNELGMLKLEKYVDEAEFIAPKVYAIKGRDEKGKPLELYKAKGISLGRAKYVQRARFKALKKGGRVSTFRMARVKENLRRRGNVTPMESAIRKRLKFETAVEKRHFYPDGTTRPWHTDEIAQLD